MNRARLILNAGKDKAVMRRHPWIFSGAVKRIDGAPAEGDIVDVYSSDGRWLATGHYQNDSIICKVLSFDKEDVGADYFKQLLKSAIEYRKRMGFFEGDENTVFRVVNGEGDSLPGLICDWYNGTLVMQAHSVGMHRIFPQLSEMFVELMGNYGIKSIFDKSSTTVPGGCNDGYLWGEKVEEREVMENGIRLRINFFEGQKTGFFVDQRENRQLVGSLAEGHRVLNCFGYTGGFSLAALHGGAEYVETVDISKKAIDLCNRNVALNFGEESAASRHKGVVADVLKYLDTIDDSFDLVILDPPAFAKNHRSLQQGLKGYRSINQKAIGKIRKGGLLFTFSCSQAVSRDDFQTMVFTSSALAGRKVRVVRQLPHAMDHPVSIYHPEGEYLKGLLLEIE
ncbi:MAG: class I SAM-dependent rRNA methyltransferase [Bacteroidales bacterium]|nr:class I SAM-dependent rRNA methyltransferase [Bacteroidales bacterium]